MTDCPATDIPQRVLALRTLFAQNSTYRTLEERFRYLYEMRRAEIAAGTELRRSAGWPGARDSAAGAKLL